MHREGRAPVRLADRGFGHVPHGPARVVAVGRGEAEAGEEITFFVISQDPLGDGQRRALRIRVIVPPALQRSLETPDWHAILLRGGVLRLLEDAVQLAHLESECE